jgi:pimeloyl-ACP methyl ester carboxylesterase
MSGTPYRLRRAALLIVTWACASCGGGSTDPQTAAGLNPRADAETPPSAAVAQTSPVSSEGSVDQPHAAVTIAGNEMCGTGDTFSVLLPGLELGDDPSTEDLAGRKLPNDSVTFPNGCDVYALIVHGYGRNSLFDELMYYKLAKWVAEHNGYVHYSWWNNLLGSYMSGPLHVIGGSARGDATYPSPGDITQFENVWDFAQGGKGKAVPDEDFQFQADAKKVLAAIRDENPNAIIIVAGHSMGGNAVARLGSETPVVIDLLAPIDPVGNRNSPKGQGGALGYGNGTNSAVPGQDSYEAGNETFNWTRWRATHRFRGWIDRDCERNAAGLCRDFDSRPLRVEHRCRTLSSTPNDKQSNGPIADEWCPDHISYSTIAFGPDVRRLYHRWQLETYFPYDWDASYHFAFTGSKANSDAAFKVESHNYQRAIGEYAVSELPPPSSLATAPKTCKHDTKKDPSGAESFDGALLDCRDWDGHGEIIGMRGTKDRRVLQNTPPLPSKENLNPLALTADWKNGGWNRTSPWLTSAGRRDAFMELTELEPWNFAPKDPDLDLVVADLVAIAEDLWANRGDPSGPDVTPPTTSADVTPEPTIHGWNNGTVVVEIAAVDEQGGSGVKHIEYTLTGASNGGGVVVGTALSLVIAAEGTTTVEYFAHDNAGNREESNTLEARIDATPPTISGDATPPPNQHGWNNTDVTVSFVAGDALSGLDTVTQPVTLTDEGAEQEVIGVATDRAGNTATIGVVVNIDKTPPVIGGRPESCELWPPNHKLVSVADLVITDELAGVAISSVTATSNEPEHGPGYGNEAPDVVIAGGNISLRSERYSQSGRIYDLAVTAIDLAGNIAEAEASCRVPHDQGK